MSSTVQFSQWFNRHQILLLRLSLGLVYLWFGVLKFFPGLSPAEDLAQDTIHILTFGLLPDPLSLLLLAIWEVGVGLLLLGGFLVRFAAKVAIVHMVLTFAPLFFFPDLSFTQAPYAFTIIGQYIVKNLVFLVALGMLLGGTRED